MLEQRLDDLVQSNEVCHSRTRSLEESGARVSHPMGARPGEELFDELDLDGSGQLSRAELDALFRRGRGGR